MESKEQKPNIFQTEDLVSLRCIGLAFEKEQNIPGVLKKQLACEMNLKRMNVTGDGNCGYYLVQLIYYLQTGVLFTLEELNVKSYEFFGETPRHYLEYLEVGILLRELDLNFAVIVQSDVKKTGTKRQKRVYPVYPVNYKAGRSWCFSLMSQRGLHYELLVIAEGKNRRLTFFEKEAKEIFESCGVEYPSITVDPCNQIVLLDKNDFLLF